MTAPQICVRCRAVAKSGEVWQHEGQVWALCRGCMTAAESVEWGTELASWLEALPDEQAEALMEYLERFRSEEEH